jgi:hypothetical protein
LPVSWENQGRVQVEAGALVKLTDSDARPHFSSALRDIPNEERFEAV